MKRIEYILIGLMCLGLLAACNASKLMYDTSQKDRLYFTMPETPRVVSFALITDKQIAYNLPVNMLGMPKEFDRDFEIEFIKDVQDSILIDNNKVETVPAVEGEDFSIGRLMIPAGKVEGVLNLTLNRTEKMKTSYASIHFRMKENEEFRPMDTDSTDIKHIITPEFRLFVNAGEPACPRWWDASTSSENYFGWHMFLGKFYPDKFRKLLELYHSMETKNPNLYRQCVAIYGVNLDAEDIQTAFFQKENPAVWATYVLIPLYDYYVEYYAEHPDDPNVEAFKKSGAAGTYWKNPLGQLK